jgi:hypothetical protein
MAPKKKRGRNDDMDEYITVTHPQTKELASTIQHLHTHYEPDQRAVRSFITVPIASVPQPPTLSSTSDTTNLPPFMVVEESHDIEDRDEGSNELEGCEVEALGLGHLLAAGIQGQTQKRRRTQAVSLPELG